MAGEVAEKLVFPISSRPQSSVKHVRSSSQSEREKDWLEKDIHDFLRNSPGCEIVENCLLSCCLKFESHEEISR